MSILKKTDLQVATDLKILNKTLSWFTTLYLPHIEQKDWLQCELALAEGLTNAIRHAHRGMSPETPINLEVVIEEERITIQIWDCGPPFSIEQYLANQDNPLNTQAGGGRGLAILQKIADVLEYNRTEDQRNCLLIVKQYSKVDQTCRD